MFGFIKNLIAGIVGLITGLIGKIFAKKDNGYYLQLNEETTSVTPVATAKSAPAKTAKAKPTAKAAPAKAPVAKVEPAKAPVPTETTFAPKYLGMASSNGRRRPGANMNTYLDMARQVKTPG